MPRKKKNSPSVDAPEIPVLPPKKQTWAWRILIWTMRTILALIALFVLVAAALQMPPVQRWTIQKATAYFSEELNTTVQISDFRVDFFDEISVGNLYISNQSAPNDTLVYVGRLRLDVSYPHLLFGITQIDAIRLEHTRLNLTRAVGHKDFNFQFIFNYLNPPREGPPTPKKTADIRIGQIHLRDFHLTQNDNVAGKTFAAYAKAVDIHTNIMNLPKQLLDVTRINLFEPFVQIAHFQSNPLPEKAKALPMSYQTTPTDNISTGSVAEAKNEQKTDDTNEKPFQLLIGAISVEGGRFKLDKWNRPDLKPQPDSILDYRHLDVSQLNLFIHNFYHSKNEFTGVVDGISLKEKSGFVLNKLVVGDAKVSPTETALYGLQIETPNSAVGDTLRFIYPEGYGSFGSFDDKVTMDARIHASKVLVKDIMTFAPKLENNKFFRQNKYNFARIEAVVFGRVNTLKLPQFDIQIGNGFRAEGRFASRDLANNNETYLDLQLKQLRTDIASLRSLIPGFKVPNEFDRLGKLGFEGTFLGFLNNFTANGRLDTDLGPAVMDIAVEPAGRDSSLASYEGNLALSNFNLGAFTGNADLGKVSMKTSILRGRGFRKDNVNVSLTAVIDSFDFKNYKYHSISLSGDLNKNLFSGILESKDPNADLNFDGTIDFAATTPLYKFKSEVKMIDLKALNFSKQDVSLSGGLEMDLAGARLSDFVGLVKAKNIVLIKDKTQKHLIDSVTLISELTTEGGYKKYRLQSEILTAVMNGRFDIDKVPNAIVNHFVRFHPRLAADLGMRLKDSLMAAQTFEFDIQVLNTKSLTKLFDNKLDTLRNIAIKGSLDDAENAFEWSIETPETHRYGDIKIVEFGLVGRSKDADIDWDLKSYNVVVGGKQDFKDLIFQNHVTGDTVEFGFTSHNFSQSLKMDTVELNALLMRQDSAYKLSFGANQLSRLKIFGDYWDISKNNFILFSKNALQIRDFNLTHGDRSITLQSIGKRGLGAALANFDISFVNSFINDARFKLDGKYKVDITFEDIFKQENFCTELTIDSLFVKGENRGKLHIDAEGRDFKSQIHGIVNLSRLNAQNQTEQLYAYGYYYPTAKDTFAANSLDVSLNLYTFPFKTLQLLIENGASRFAGRVDGNLRISGQTQKLNFDGKLRLRDVAVTVDYLKSRINVRDGIVKVTNTMFDATGQSIYDSLGHRAIVRGGLTHNRFKDFGLNVNVKADTFLCLNTTREDNPLYYGYGIGKGDITFTGDFKRTDIRIDATTGRGTRIVFPFATEQTASETGFVVFKSKKTSDSSDTLRRARELRGVNLDMTLRMTDQAEATLIFDEIAGDNIRARGEGDIHLTVNRTGEMNMVGEYRITKGDYLFTLLRVVNKQFSLKPGGSIRWNGNPFNAQINIDAEYKQLNAAPYNFIAEFVEGDQSAKVESRKPTPVELSLKLSGSLLRPNIDFDVNFPRLITNLKNYTETKLRLLRQDPNELNRQVFGLVVVGSFLPSDAGLVSSQQLRSGSLNTVLESAGSVLSGFFNKLIGEYVTGFDVEIAANVFDDSDGLNTGRTGQVYRVRGNYEINDRWTVSGGLGVETGDLIQQTTGSNVFIGGDVLVDYSITADRRFKLRLSYTRDQIFEGRRDKPAIGIRYRKEFDSFEEFFNSFKITKKTTIVE